MRRREVLDSFEPYAWEPSNEELASRVGLRPEEIHRFDTNASPYTPVGWLDRLAADLKSLKVNDYPDTSYSRLRRKLSEYASVDPELITVTNGEDEALDIVGKSFIDQGTEVIISSPTYSYYRVVGEILGARVVAVPRREAFVDDDEGIIDSITEATRLIFLCSPNNPTGNTLRRRALQRILSTSPVPVVIDEAYWEFSGENFADLLREHDNLILLRTFSKAFSLAGARVGYALASHRVTSLLNKVRPPNSLSVISLALAEIALEDTATLRTYIDVMVRVRERCADFLKRLKRLVVYPSRTNFLLVRPLDLDATSAHDALLKRGLIVRDFSRTRGLEGCIRFNVRLPPENDLLLQALAELVQET